MALKTTPRKIPIFIAIFDTSLALSIFFAPKERDTIEVTEIEIPIATNILKKVYITSELSPTPETPSCPLCLPTIIVSNTHIII